MTLFHTGLAWITAWSCALACAPVNAQSHDKAAAEALFDEGRKLMAAGNYPAACPKLEASQALDAGIGTQLNLADCYEKLGKTASAWALFRETAAAARSGGSPERERVARERADTLQPQLARLKLLAPEQREGVSITRDGARVDPAAIGSALPIDPGDYTIAASAPGKRSWSTHVTVEPASHVTVSVPPLEDAPNNAESSPKAAKLIGVIASGAGVAALAVGGFFGLRAASSWSDAKSSCDPYPYCGEMGQQLASDAQQRGTIATIATVAGGVLLAGGLVLWLTAAESPRQSETALLLGPGAIGLRGSFQ